jgi:hypothetical protein
MNAADPLVEAYGLTAERSAEVRARASALEAVVLRLAAALPFDAEPWGFGQALWRLAPADDRR